LFSKWKSENLIWKLFLSAQRATLMVKTEMCVLWFSWGCMSDWRGLSCGVLCWVSWSALLWDSIDI
jgi:hypothetical protein